MRFFLNKFYTFIKFFDWEIKTWFPYITQSFIKTTLVDFFLLLFLFVIFCIEFDFFHFIIFNSSFFLINGDYFVSVGLFIYKIFFYLYTLNILLVFCICCFSLYFFIRFLAWVCSEARTRTFFQLLYIFFLLDLCLIFFELFIMLMTLISFIYKKYNFLFFFFKLGDKFTAFFERIKNYISKVLWDYIKGPEEEEAILDALNRVQREIKNARMIWEKLKKGQWRWFGGYIFGIPWGCETEYKKKQYKAVDDEMSNYINEYLKSETEIMSYLPPWHSRKKDWLLQKEKEQKEHWFFQVKWSYVKKFWLTLTWKQFKCLISNLFLFIKLAIKKMLKEFKKKKDSAGDVKTTKKK